uniref:Uncharacterized protein n=1 Tax=Pithovirus LCPAC304 TaxID=2506594 RepID=A0A481Z788_9VIRU|nr:MAG: hypothetical protein LCPAC304_00540 [Pithovirus LCPAC304]
MSVNRFSKNCTGKIPILQKIEFFNGGNNIKYYLLIIMWNVPSKAYLRKKSLFQFEEVLEEEGKWLHYPDQLCKELMFNKALLHKHGDFDHGLYKLPPEIILKNLLPHCITDWIRVVGFYRRVLQIGGRREERDDKVLIFLQTTDVRDVCQYLGMKTSHPPHAFAAGLVEGDKIIHLSVYEKPRSRVVSKGSTIVVRYKSDFRRKECPGKCNCIRFWRENLAEYI